MEARGYAIRSVAGSSMGALIGGIYCTGRLNEVEKWLYSLGKKEVFSLVDWSLGSNHLVKGDKVIETLKDMVPDTPIEELPTHFRAIAADLETQREVVFSRGSLYRAIRASISIPSVLKPMVIGSHILVDGGIVNPLPLNRAVRTEGDILVSVNVSAPADAESGRTRKLAEQERREKRTQDTGYFKDKLSVDNLIDALTPKNVSSNYISLMTSAFTLLIQRLTVMSLKLTPPDIRVDIPMNRFGVFDFEHAELITEEGYKAMEKAIEEWESDKA